MLSLPGESPSPELHCEKGGLINATRKEVWSTQVMEGTIAPVTRTSTANRFWNTVSQGPC